MNITATATGVAILSCLAVSPAAAQAADPLQTVADFTAASTTGDIARAERDCLPSISIVDDFAPFHWSGPTGVRPWMRDFQAFMVKTGVDSVSVRAAQGMPAVTKTDYAAYVVSSDVISLVSRSGTVQQSGSNTIVLERVGPDWRIAAWTWSDQPSAASPAPIKE